MHAMTAMRCTRARARALGLALGLALLAPAGTAAADEFAAGARAALATVPPEVFPESPVTERLLESARAARGSVQRLTATIDDGGAAHVPVLLGDEEVVLRLWPHTDRHPEVELYVTGEDGELIAAELPAPRTWRGWVEGDADRPVAATIAEEHFSALVLEPDGSKWTIQPAPSDEADLGAVFEGWSIVKRNEDVIPTGGVCGVPPGTPADPRGLLAAAPDELLAAMGAGNAPATGATDDEGASEDPPVLASGGPEGGIVRTEVAFDADWEFYLESGATIDGAVLEIERVMNEVGLIYQEQTLISYWYRIFLVRTSSNDPYTSSDSFTRLCQLRTHWNTVLSFFPRDTVHMFTGVDLDGNIVGRAFLGAICEDGNACGGVTDDIGYGLSWTYFSTSMAERTTLVAHELGHNWNACHCNDSDCTGGGGDVDCGIMNSFVLPGEQDFGNRSITAIAIWRALSLGCLDTAWNPVWVDVDWGGSENGSAVFPFDTLSEGVYAAIVDGLVAIRNGTYTPPAGNIIAKPLVLQRADTGGGSVVITP